MFGSNNCFCEVLSEQKIQVVTRMIGPEVTEPRKNFN